MSYQKWEHRDGTLIVEKYTGEMEIGQVMGNDDELFEAIAEVDGRILILTDISEASLKNIKYDQLEEIFSSIAKNETLAYGMQLALYVGLNNYEDFLKASKYAEQDVDRSISIIPFNFLDTAMTWLGFNAMERELITRQLSE